MKKLLLLLIFILTISCKKETYSESSLKEYIVHRIEAETFRGTTDVVTSYRIYLLSNTSLTSVVLDAN